MRVSGTKTSCVVLLALITYTAAVPTHQGNLFLLVIFSQTFNKRSPNY